MNGLDRIPAIGSAPAIASVPAPGDGAFPRPEVVHAVEALNAAQFFGEESELTFTMDQEGRRAVLRLVDRKTNEVIRQIPPEYVLNVARELRRQARQSGSAGE